MAAAIRVHVCFRVWLRNTAEEGAEPLLPGEWFEGTVQIFFPPVAATGFPGYVGSVAYPFEARAVSEPTP